MSPTEGTKPLAVVTGGGTGIGLATAQRLMSLGYDVTSVGLAREDELPEGLAFVELDVANDAAVREFSARFPRLDALVNAAGMNAHNRGEYEMPGFRRVIEVNLIGTANLCLAFHDALRRTSGAIVNIASMAAIFGAALTPAYAASKGAIVQLTKSFAVAWAEEGIRVNAVAPGWIDTRICTNAIHNEARAPSILARLPMKRWGQPSDVARVISFLLSDEAAYVTGSLYAVDGGYSSTI